MSTTEERLRALRLTRELLQAVAVEERLPSSLRTDAQSCLERYPENAEIRAWLDESAPVEPAPWGIAFIFARTILEQLLIVLPVDDSLHQGARFAERHFPEPMWLPGGLNPDPWEPMFLDPMRALRRYGA